jgi:hypothetical protein
MLAKNTNLLANVRDLSVSDFSLMTFISYELKRRLSLYFKIDSFTMPDPFPVKEDFNYFIIVDKSNTSRVIAFIAIKNDVDMGLWDIFLGEDMVRLDLPPEDIFSLKKDLMPKETNNFYPLRKEGSIIGSAAFAFEICGKKDPYPPPPPP